MEHIMEFNTGPYRKWVLLFLVVLITAEIIWNWRSNKKNYLLKETVTNILIFTGFQFSKYLFAAYQLWLLTFFYKAAPYTFKETAVVFTGTFIFIDFLYYWYHRISHVVKIFWAFHLVHHSSLLMNLTTSYRLNWFGALVTPLFFIPAAIAGLPPNFISVAFAINLMYQFFLHTEAIGKLGFMEGIINTPSAHRVHHGSNKIYLDKNFGGVLMLWDKLFGTYTSETEKVKYGITTGFVSYNPFKLVFQGFIDLVKGKMHYKG
jgi:sterol desaturase/sphingolipid hydroxylase (fatty acid hydroxylase superfamily)